MTSTEDKPCDGYNFGFEAWKIGKKLTRLHIKQRKMVNSSEAFADQFPDLLEKCKGNKTLEGILFFSMHTFTYGYNFPGFPWSYVEPQCNMILSSKPGDQCRLLFR